MFSQTAEYALRIMVYLASLGDRSATISQISQATRTPAGYLAKILRNLAKAHLLRSQRGLHGGSTLARPADQVTVYDVVQAVDPIQRITTCPLGLKNHGVNLCPLHRRLDEAIASVERAFRATTLAEVVAEPTRSKPLLDDIPTIPASGLVPARVLRAKH
jgi:Rrf2 family transcriptional regulator, nitric oxide-sensitive transcriptional repressor